MKIKQFTTAVPLLKHLTACAGLTKGHHFLVYFTESVYLAALLMVVLTIGCLCQF